MTQELQALLERINQEGVSQAQAEKERIIGEAQKEAEKILEKARSEAEKTTEEARKEAELLVRKGEESLRQAERDILLSLGEKLRERMQATVKACLAADASPEEFGRVIAEFVQRQLQEQDISEAEVEIPEKDQRILTEHIFNALGQELQDNTVLTPLPSMESGFRLRFDQGDVIYDFSDQALTEALTSFLGPRLLRIFESASENPES